VGKIGGDIQMPSTVATLFSGEVGSYFGLLRLIYVVYYNGILYFAYQTTTDFNVIKIGLYNISSPAGTIPVMYTLPTDSCSGLAINSTGSFVYASGGLNIYKISTTSPYNTTTLSQISNAGYVPGSIAIDMSGNIYAFSTLQNDNTIVKQDTSNNVTIVSTNSALANTKALAITSNNNTLYALAGQTIQKVTISGGGVAQVANNDLLTNSNSLAINRNNTYLFGTNGIQVFSFNISNGASVAVAGNGSAGIVDGPNGTGLTVAKFNGAYGITIGINDNMYVADNKNSKGYMRLVTNFDPDPVPCFKEGTKILTDKGYVPIETLRSGDKVQTFKDGFVPIHAIGKRVINNPGVEERIAEQLYVCSPSKFSEVFEDLVITGYHSLLSKNFESIEQEEQAKELLGKIYITDGYYRIPICIDKRAEVYKEKDSAMIYHFALEHQDYYMNYGVYANGLLVESTSKRYLLELSGMELI
jgi:Hint domain